MRRLPLLIGMILAIGLLPVAPGARGQIAWRPSMTASATPALWARPTSGSRCKKQSSAPDNSALQRPGTRTAGGPYYPSGTWYNMGVALWRDPPTPQEAGTQIGEWLFVAESRLYQQRVIQLVRPEIIVERLEPDSYTLFVTRQMGEPTMRTALHAAGRPRAARSANGT